MSEIVTKYTVNSDGQIVDNKSVYSIENVARLFNLYEMRLENCHAKLNRYYEFIQDNSIEYAHDIALVERSTTLCLAMSNIAIRSIKKSRNK